MIDNLAARHISDADPQEEIHRLIRFEGTFEEFLCKWLSAVCHCASASQAAVLDRDETHGNIVAKAIFPSTEVGGGMPFWLQQFAAQLGRNADWPAECSIHDIPVPGGFYGQTQKVFAYPLGIDGTKLIAAFLISGECDSKRLAAITAPFTCLINNYVAGRKVSVQENSLRRFRKLFELQSSLRHHARFGPLAMAICNEIATAAGAERVSLGVLGGHFVKCMAMSHTEKLNRKMKVVRQVEQAMEECLDQQQVVIYPAGDGDRAVTRMAEELSRHHGSGQIIAIPITPADEPKIVILMEFTDRRNDLKELLEITGAICEVEAARLYEFYLHSCWFGIRIAREIKKFAAIVVGAKHTWLKLAAIAIICVLFWAVFFRGDYEIESPVVLEAVQQRVVAAPFECYLVEADVQPGDYVQAGKTMLGRLDDGELRQQLASLEARRQTSVKRAAMAMREGKTAESQVELAQAKQAQADMDIVRYKLSKVNIVAPTSGYLVSEDMGKQLGRAFKIGDVLFEIAAVDSLRAVIRVEEEDISQLSVGQSGEFAIIANPDKKLRFTIERIHPAANVVEQKNIFEVWAKIEERPTWLRPGLEGEAHIYVGKRRHIWIWTHRAADWIQMKLWQWF